MDVSSNSDVHLSCHARYVALGDLCSMIVVSICVRGVTSSGRVVVNDKSMVSQTSVIHVCN